ncbi:MAG: hypothetical protein ACI87J_001980 [Colwellia sp.]|jgi:hypothetical protein
MKAGFSVQPSLDEYLSNVRQLRTTYQEGLELAKTFTILNGGNYSTCEENQTTLTLGNEIAICFQPYPDIDRLYFES